MKNILRTSVVPLYALFSLFLLISFTNVPSAYGQEIFGTDVDIDELVEINKFNGDVSDIGPLAFENVEALACDLNTQTLYAVDVNTNQLLTLNKDTGEATVIGTIPAEFENIFGLAYDPTTNTLYGSEISDDVLVIIDTETGDTSEVGPIGFFSVRSLAYDHISQTLYGFDADEDILIVIDVETGAGTEIGELGIETTVAGLTFDPATRKLFGSSDEFVEIDPQTAQATIINDFIGNVHGLGICRDIRVRNIPTLSEWGLIAMAGIIGLAGLIAVRRKYAVN